MITATQMATVTQTLVLDELEVGELGIYFDDRSPQEILKWAMDTFGDRLGLVTSFQAEGMVLLDMAVDIHPNIRVITMDTGMLPEASYRYMEEIQKRYNISLEVHHPDKDEVERMINRRGMNLFYEDVPSRLLCCQIRKVRPFLKALQGLDAWITGLRREQWASRINIRKIELDHDHGAIVKLNPLADWTEDEIWSYFKVHNIPKHPLYEKGYVSIGCAPCTRSIKPGENPRSGRWWWEKNAPKECGMHCSIESGGFEHELDAILGDPT